MKQQSSPQQETLHEYCERDIDSLIPYANNSRTHSEEQIAQIAASILEFGFTNPLLIDENGGIIAGHGRIMAARRLGMESVPCIVLDGLTEAQKKALVIADNKLAINAGWDEELLAAEIERLMELDFDTSLLGFDDDELEALLAEAIEETEGLTDPDEVPDVEEQPVSVPGDLWVLGRHKVLCGDSTNIDDVSRIAPPEGSIVRKVNFDENPWFPETLDLERRWMQRTDPDAYAHVWLGECRQYTDAQVLRGKWTVEPFEPDPDTWHGPYYGADWGYAKDPTALVRCWIHDGRLYIEHEAYQVGCEIDQTPALFEAVPGSRAHLIRADSARPETISYMRRQGFRIIGAKKGKGSVEDGVAHLRGYEQIIIHPRCTHTAEEARLWSFKVDKLTGDVLPRLEDKNNHCWDAVRYALEPIIRGGAGKRVPLVAGERVFR